MVGMGHAAVSGARRARPAVTRLRQTTRWLRPQRAVWCSLGADIESESRGAAERVRLDVPIVTLRKRTFVAYRDGPYLDFRGHRVVRACLLLFRQERASHEVAKS